MKNLRTILYKLVIVGIFLCVMVDCNDHYDPYKNPPPPSTPEDQHKPSSDRPLLMSCSKQPEEPGPPSSGSSDESGCSRKPDTNQRAPRHQREHTQGEEEENGLIYPCPDHIFPFCTDENPFGITYKSGTKGIAAFPKSSDIGCLRIAPCPTWYYMQIDHPGDLLIYIEQNGLLGKLDVDFACWGPFEASSKRDFLDKLCASYYSLHVDYHPNHRPKNGNHRRDTGGYPFDNLVDCSFDPEGTEWCYIPNAKSGEWYLLLLTNYSRKRGTIHFERVDNMSTATTNCSVVVPITLNPQPRDRRHIDDHTTAICLYEEKALVTIELEADEGYNLTRKTLRNCEVTVLANNRTYQAALKKDHFECEIDILNDTTEYIATIICSDPEFAIEAEPYFFVRTSDCDLGLIQFTSGNPHYAGELSTIELVKGDKPVNVDFSSPGGATSVLPDHPGSLNLDDYDITIDYDRLFIERVDIKKDRNNLELTPQMRGDWCNCFVPDTMTFTLRMVPNNGDVSATPYEIPIQISISQQTIWIGRCLWVLISIGLLILFILYLVALLHKNRFKKSATITPIYYNYHGSLINDQGPTFLRKEGFSAWFARWFLPGDEHRTLTFDAPEACVHFVAANSFEMVNIPKNSIDSNMRFNRYDPQRDSTPQKPIELISNERIYISMPNGNDAGFLTFTVSEQNDGSGYRLILFLLLIAATICIVVLIVLMFNGLI